MDKQTIVNYLNNNLAKGFTIDQLQNQLTSQGIDPNLIQQAIQEINNEQTNQTSQINQINSNPNQQYQSSEQTLTTQQPKEKFSFKNLIKTSPTANSEHISQEELEKKEKDSKITVILLLILLIITAIATYFVFFN